MTTSRLNKLFLQIDNNSNKYIILDTYNDIFCQNNLVITSLKFQLYNFLIGQIERIAFLENDKVYFLDNKSYKSFLKLDIEQNDLVSGPLGLTKIINTNVAENYMQKLFYISFLDQLEHFLSEKIKSIYIFDMVTFNSIISTKGENIINKSAKNNIFIVISNNLNQIKISNSDLESYKFIELNKPDKDEINNILNLLNLKNNLEVNYNLDKIVVDSLNDFYHKLINYKDDYLEIDSLFTTKDNKDDIKWLEF